MVKSEGVATAGCYIIILAQCQDKVAANSAKVRNLTAPHRTDSVCGIFDMIFTE